MSALKKTPSSDILVKVIIVGDSGVGKTNLLTYFCEGIFKDSYVATIGVDFKIKMVQVDDKKIKLQIWDTAGQQRFRNITQTYYKGASGIILAYSIADGKSFSNVAGWIKQIEANSTESVSKVLIATKCDLQSQRQVTYDEGKALAQKYNMKFYEVSAKVGTNVTECFTGLTRQIKERREEADHPLGNQVSLKIEKNNPTKKNGCSC